MFSFWRMWPSWFFTTLKRDVCCGEWGTRPAFHELTPATLLQKTIYAFRANLLICISWTAGWECKDLLVRGSWHMRFPVTWHRFQPWCWSITRKCRHNTDWRGCSSFDSGACFHGRFTVPFAWLIEACQSRKHKSAFSRDIWASQAGQREAGENCTLLICTFWFRCFHNSLKAPCREREVWKQLFESTGLLVWISERRAPWHCEIRLSTRTRGFLPVLRMELGTSHPRYQHCLGSTVVHVLLFLLLSYRLDQPTNYRHFYAHSWREGVVEWGGNGGSVWHCGSPPLCCSTRD